MRIQEQIFFEISISYSVEYGRGLDYVTERVSLT